MKYTKKNIEGLEFIADKWTYRIEDVKGEYCNLKGLSGPNKCDFNSYPVVSILSSLNSGQSKPIKTEDYELY